MEWVLYLFFFFFFFCFFWTQTQGIMIFIVLITIPWGMTSSLILESQDWDEIERGSPTLTTIFSPSADGKTVCVLKHRCCLSNNKSPVNDCKNGVRKCETQNYVKPVTLTSTVCRKKSREVCNDPCFGCPTFCQPETEFQCEDEIDVS